MYLASYRPQFPASLSTAAYVANRQEGEDVEQSILGQVQHSIDIMTQIQFRKETGLHDQADDVRPVAILHVPGHLQQGVTDALFRVKAPRS